MALPTTGLILDLRAGVGITASGGRISQWNDQSAAGNHLTQTTAAAQPYDAVDEDGEKIVRFPAGTGNLQNAAVYFDLPSSLVISNQRAHTMLIVARIVSWNVAQQAIISHSTTAAIAATATWYIDIMGAGGPGAAPNFLLGTRYPDTNRIYVPNNKTIHGFRSRSGAVDFYSADKTQSTATQAPANTNMAGGTFGRYSTTAAQFSKMNVYRVLIWDRALTDQEITDAKAALVSEYSLATGFTKLAVIKGDSIIQGSLAVDNRVPTLGAFPADWLCYTLGYGGEKIGTSTSDASTMRARRATWIDPLYDAAMAQNVLVIMGGTNDMAVPSTAAQIIANMEGFVDEILAANTWDVRVQTVPERNDNGYATVSTDYNVLIRALDAGDGVSAIIDAGKGGDIPLGRLDDSSDTTWFFTDKVHPLSSGSFAIRSAIWANATGSPLAPHSPVVDSVQANGATVSFSDASTGETGFKLQRRLQAAGSAWSTVASGAASPLTDTSAAAGTAYYYRVVSYNGTAESTSDFVVLVITADTTAPTVTAATINAAGQLVLTCSEVVTITGSATAWTATHMPTGATYTGASASADGDTLTITFGSPLPAGVVTWAFNAALADVEDPSDNAMLSIAAGAIDATNNSEVAEPVAASGWTATRSFIGCADGIFD